MEGNFVVGVVLSGGVGGRDLSGLLRVLCTGRISVASRSASSPTRLETRTKESNMYASHWVF